MQPNAPRSTVEFDTGIGSEMTDPRLLNALAGMQQQKHESYLAGRTAAQPAAEAVPLPPEPPPAAPADEYRARNPSLPKMRFDTVKHLPSVGKAYPANATILFRPYTLGESIYAEESKPDMRGTYALILAGLECQGFDPMTLTLPDVLYLGLIRKIASLGATKVSVTTTCPYCKGLNRTPIECTELEFDDLQVPALPIRAPFTFGDHTFSPLTLSSYLDLLDAGLEDNFLALMAAQCTSIPIFEDALAMTKDLTDPDDIAMLKQIDELLHHELKPVVVTCPQELPKPNQEVDEPAPTCGRRYPVALDDVSAAFVLPFSGRSQESIRGKITFG